MTVASIVISLLAITISVLSIRSSSRTIAGIEARLRNMCPTCGAQIRQWSGSGTSAVSTAHPCGHKFTIDPHTRWPHAWPV